MTTQLPANQAGRGTARAHAPALLSLLHRASDSRATGQTLVRYDAGVLYADLIKGAPAAVDEGVPAERLPRLANHQREEQSGDDSGSPGRHLRGRGVGARAST